MHSGALPATVSAEGAQFNGAPFPATVSAEGRLIKGGPSLFKLDSHRMLHDICHQYAWSSAERGHSMFEGFEHQQITTSGTTINLVKGGSGPGLLLLHGYPQTHAMWHKIAPRLAQDFTVVAADLRGYGDSGKAHGDPEHLTYSKRAMAQDQVEVMQQLGFETFNVVGHDRGARVSHRLTLDHPQRVQRLALLDIIPTHKMFRIVNQEMATSTYHWFFLIQPYDLPERLIGAAPERYLQNSFGRTPEAHAPEAQ